MSLKQNSSISLWKIIIGIVIFSLSVASGYFFGEPFMKAEKPAEYVGVTFSILAGSLFAVVSIVGDPSMLVTGNSRKAWVTAKVLQNELQKFYLLFLWYLVTLGLLVISELIESAKYCQFYWVVNLLVFFATAGFLFSLFIPYEFSRIQKRRIEQELKQ